MWTRHPLITNRILGLLIAAHAAAGQTPAAKPEFEVASIKPAPPDATQKDDYGMKVDKAQVAIRGFSMADLIVTAYRVSPRNIASHDALPAGHFDIEAKLPEGATTDQVPEMLLTLLAERFKLAAHRETQDRPVYALVVGKNGSKLKGSAPAPEGSGSGMKLTMRDGSIQHYDFPRESMARLAGLLTAYLDRPVVDMTGLKGTYEATVEMSLTDIRNGESTTLFESVEKLGLKLEPRKAAIEMLVIDHVEKTPTEN